MKKIPEKFHQNFTVDKMYKKLYNRTMDEKIRINKYLSEAGICSRREADRMIEEGRITVNGKKQKAVRKSAWKMRSVQTIYLSIKMKKSTASF